MKSNIPKHRIEKFQAVHRKMQMKLHQGDSVYCPICHSSFSKFGTYGLKARENAMCYNCGSRERHRLIFKYLKEELNFFSPDNSIRLMHIGPEKAFFNLFSNMDRIDYVPCDINPDKYKNWGKNTVIKADITNLPFEDHSFDFIICIHVLEHIEKDLQAMKEMLRVMKLGGNGIIQVPVDLNRKETFEDPSICKPKEREISFGQFDHVRVYGLDFMDRLKSVGFKVDEVDFVKKLSAEEKIHFGLVDEERIYHCTK